MEITKEQILKIVDQCFHSYASSFRSEAKQKAITLINKHESEQLIIPVVSKSVNCDHPRSERSYIGQNMLRCNKCGKEFS